MLVLFPALFSCCFPLFSRALLSQVVAVQLCALARLYERYARAAKALAVQGGTEGEGEGEGEGGGEGEGEGGGGGGGGGEATRQMELCTQSVSTVAPRMYQVCFCSLPCCHCLLLLPLS